MIAIILAGGRGERLRPITHYLPKVLLPIGTKPLLDFILDRLRLYGFSEIFVAVSDFYDLVDRYVKVSGYDDVKPVRVLGWETGGDLLLALEGVNAIGDVLVWNGDTLIDLDLSVLLRDHESLGTLVTLTGVLVPSHEALRKKGVITLENGRVSMLIEKPLELSVDTVLVNGGVYVLDSRFVEERGEFLSPRKCSLEEEVFPRLIQRRELGASLAHCSYLVDVGLPEDYVKAFLRFSQTQ